MQTKLYQPLTLGPKQARNRILFGSHTARNNLLSSQHSDYCAARAEVRDGVRLMANHFLASFGPNSATIINNYTGQSRLIEQLALAVIVTPQIANDGLYHRLQGKVKQLYRVGDCVAPRRVEHAILDGERIARALSMQPTTNALSKALQV